MAQAFATRPIRGLGASSPAFSLGADVLRRGLAVVRRRPTVAAGTLLVLATASAVGWNALAVQTGKHPAPLFGARPPQRVVAAAPLPPARPPLALPSGPSAPAAAKPPLRDLSVEITRSTEPAVRPPAAAPRRDPIGDVIRGDQVSPAAKPDGQRGVTSAQKALIKLGYGPAKPDGVLGPATRQAIERFERDRRLPVTGELGSRTMRELAGQAGVAIE